MFKHVHLARLDFFSGAFDSKTTFHYSTFRGIVPEDAKRGIVPSNFVRGLPSHNISVNKDIHCAKTTVHHPKWTGQIHSNEKNKNIA